jgi:hypothetical protein
MPKETIKSKFSDNRWLSVGWGNRGVQVGVSAGTYFKFVNGKGEPLPDEDVYVPGKKPGVCDSLYFQLESREAINDLIVNLRRARDNTFGRDQ